MRAATLEWSDRCGERVSTCSPFARRRHGRRTRRSFAVGERRMLLTEDKDFGRLAHASGAPPVGVILLRFPATARRMLPQTVLRLIRDRGEGLLGCFSVVQPGRIRIRRRT